MEAGERDFSCGRGKGILKKNIKRGTPSKVAKGKVFSQKLKKKRKDPNPKGTGNSNQGIFPT